MRPVVRRILSTANSEIERVIPTIRAAAVFRDEPPQEFPIEVVIAKLRVIDARYRPAAAGGWDTP
jgi:hypothetical protein